MKRELLQSFVPSFLVRWTVRYFCWLRDVMGKFFFSFLGPHLWHMEAARLGVEPELQLLSYTPATVTPDVSLIFDLQLVATLDP